MSEQEMDLDTAIQLFQLVQNFDEYREGIREVLTKVHSQEELDRARKVIDEKKQDLTENNPEFNTIMEQRKREAKMRSDESKAIHKAKMAEVTADANRIRSEAMMKAKSARMDADRMRSGVDDWVAKTRIKTRTFDEAKEQSEQKLVCPICNASSKGNIINDTPTCCHNTKEHGPWHRLVPQSELKNYNRSYRRRWKKKKK